MGKFKDENGKTRVGTFLQSIGNVAPDLLKLAGNITGVDALEKLGKAIDKDTNLTDEQKATAKELLEIDLANVQGARNMQIEALRQDDKFSKRFVYYLASFWSIAGVIYLFLATFTEIVNEKIADTVLGFLLGTIVATIINFFFGSSKGSSDKTISLLNLINKAKNK